MTLIFRVDADIMSALCYGDVPKWLKGADSKSARRRKACGGSNPSISAIKIAPIVRWVLFLKIVAGEGFEPPQMQRPGGLLLATA